MEANRILLANKYARIINILALKNCITRREAMRLFYESDTVNLLDEGVSDLHCEGCETLASEVLIEDDMKKASDMEGRLLAYYKALIKLANEQTNEKER